ncbi:MAG: protein kinase domain-containing protein [Hyphomonas sp.]
MSEADTLEQQALKLLTDALEQPSTDREDWVRKQAGDNAALVSRVLALLEADGSVNAALRTGGAKRDAGDAPPPDRAGPYKITGMIGRGGMGAVYKGERDSGDFKQIAAIKIIRPGVLSDSLIARFERERQILADLSHPNIARLFDGGALPDGSPYFVMEYVDGEPITEWADTAGLGLDDRLWLFRDICTAVRHAHQNLIVHRDITPSNVLVTKSGTVKLIDFGIAKPHSDELAEVSEAPPSTKSLASLSFTPGYGAPERAQGAPANTLSDIYSLGKLLEALVQNHPPNADVAAIIARAAADNMEERYASVDALIEDLTNLRTGYPVEARAGGTLYKFRKFLSRNRLAMTLGTLALVGLIGALGVTLHEYNRAEQARHYAAARFEQARGLSKVFITDVYDAIEHIPGSLEARENLAGIVKDYVDELAADPNAPDDVLMDVAVQNTRLSDLYGGLGVANFGDTETSFALLLKAEEALNRLLERSPDDVHAIDEMAWVKRLKANQEMSYQLDMNAARRTNEEGLALVERGMTLPGADETKLFFRLWNSRTDRVKILMYQNDYETAIAEARRYRDELAASEYEEKPRRRLSRLAYFARLEGEGLSDTQHWEDSIPPLEYAVEAYDEILAENTAGYYYNLQKMTALNPLVMSYLKAGKGDEALQTSKEAVRIAETLREGDPKDAASRAFLATQLEMDGRVESEFGDRDAALSAIMEALDIRRRVIADFPDTAGHRRDLAGTLKTAAVVYQGFGLHSKACDALHESMGQLTLLNTAKALTNVERDVWIPEVSQQIANYSCPSE